MGKPRQTVLLMAEAEHLAERIRRAAKGKQAEVVAWLSRELQEMKRTAEGRMMPTAERERKASGKRRGSGFERVPTEDAGVLASKVIVECVVDRYHQRAQITDRQRDAGLRLRRYWRAAVLEPSVVSAYGEQRGSGNGSAAAMDARHALRNSLVGAGIARELVGEEVEVTLTATAEKIPMLRLPIRLSPAGDVTVTVCGMDEWAGGTRRLMLLRDGLSALADHWKMER